MGAGVVTQYLIGAAIPILLFSIFVFLGIRELKKWMAIRRTPTSDIKDVKGGLVEVVGRVRQTPMSDLITPFKGTPCVYFRATIKERVSSGKNKRWKIRYSKEKGVPFIVEDDIWGILIDPKGADLDPEDGYEYCNWGKRPGEEESIILESLSLPLKGTFGVFYRNYRIEEKLLPIGKEVYVIGNAKDTGVKDNLADDIIMSRYTIQKDGMFMISGKGEQAVASRKLGLGVCYLVLSIIVGLGSALVIRTIFDTIQ